MTFQRLTTLGSWPSSASYSLATRSADLHAVLDLGDEGTTFVDQLHSITSWTTQVFFGTAVRTPNRASHIVVQIYGVTDGSQTVFRKKYSVDFQLEMDVFLQN